MSPAGTAGVDISLARMDDNKEDIRSIVGTAMDEYDAKQDEAELMTVAHVVEDHVQPETIVEIGTYKGGSFYVWTNYFEALETAVSVDTDNHSSRVKTLKQFKKGVDITCERGKSQDESIVNSVCNKVEEDGIDFLYIDGSSSYEDVYKDYINYQPLVNEGGIIAFHDIQTHKSRPNDVEVHDVWNDVRNKSLSTQIKTKEDEYGYGLMFMY